MENSCGLEFSVVQIKFIALGLVNISISFIILALPCLALNFYPNMLVKIPALIFHIGNYGGPLQIIVQKIVWVIENYFGPHSLDKSVVTDELVGFER